MHRKMTPSELEDATIARIEAGAVGRNAVVCRCGRIIEHFPNIEHPLIVFRNNLIAVDSCDWCEGRPEQDP